MKRPCGCPEDYHLADCPILTSRRNMEDAIEEYFERQEDDYCI